MADDGDAARYHRLQLALAAAGLAAGVVYLVAALVTGAARAIGDAVGGPWWLRVAAIAAALGAAWSLLVFPLAWVRGFWLPRRFGLLHQSLTSWLGDRAKAGLLGGALSLAAVEVVYALVRATAWWWLAAAAVFFLAGVLMTAVVPLVVIPLFYRLTPLTDAALRDRLLALARRTGVPVVGVWVADQSRKSRTANAALVGLGRTRRIVLFDTLLAHFAPEEIEAVLAHELGHHVHGDIRRGLVAQGLLNLAVFGVAAGLLDAGARWWGFAGPGDPAGLPWLALVLMVLGLVALPLANGFSRWLERQADDFALLVTGNAGAFVDAMERLASLNLAERRPHRLKELMLYSHPAIDRRIARARGEAA
jgi:STE24 endopeptidase